MSYIMVEQRHHSQSNNNVIGLRFLIISLVTVLWLKSVKCVEHLLNIDQHEFRSRVYPIHQLPPPPLLNSDELPHHFTAKELTPSEYMVDLTNDLTYRILHYHSILNRNNFAFSPTALMSVLVALYEGSAGRSRSEMKTVLQFPNNPDIIRIGYRDIHRRLRTYFFGSDNPLKGLSLNKENITITRDYESILMFYGYDLGVDMVSSTTMSTTIAATVTSIHEEEQETTKTPTPLDLTATVTTTPTIITTTTDIVTNNAETTTFQQASTKNKTDEMLATTKSEDLTDTIDIEVEENITKNETDSLTTAETVIDISSASTLSETITEETAELISTFVAVDNKEPFLRIQKARVTRLPSAKLQAPIMTKRKPLTNYLPAQKKTARLTSRNKRHLFDFKEYDPNFFITLLNTESQANKPLLTTGPALTKLPAYIQVSNHYQVNADPNFITSSQTSNLKQNYNTDVITHVFYLNSQHIIYTTFKIYNAVLYYKYFDYLRMSVLELELDTMEYNLIILLPDYNTELSTAASSLRSAPKLRLMRKQLKPKWVRAIIPDFKLHGTMYLTNDLQNLGICDIFEPNRADFRPLTDEKAIYVKHIEQSINIHIRTNAINQLRRNNWAQRQPIQISVNHPFMFFIIDRDLDVAVMAGRILNPLNVRVQ